MRFLKKFAAALLGAAMVVAICPTGIASAATINTYTYNYDYWGIEYESPDAYTPLNFTDGQALGTTDLKLPQGLFARDNMLYIVDTGNNRILEVQVEKETLTLVREISGATGNAEVLELNAPNDVYVAENGDIYIADTGNQRVLHVNKDLEVIKEITKPNDATVDQDVAFEPTKLSVDRAGRIVVLAKNVNKGFMRFENDGTYIGFMGANKVVFNFADYIKKVFSTKAQREQMDSFVPTEYNNIYIDANSFVYCSTAVFEEADAKSGDATPIRKLNSYGDDILIRNGENPPMGDWDWDDAAGMNGPSRIADITAMPDETYYAVDRIRGRVFGYDEQGHLLYAFGGTGTKLGYFTLPTAIEHVGTDLFVLDATRSGVTRLVRTEFGNMIHNALSEYREGHYDVSSDYWEQVLDRNGNYELAYIGIGRSLLRQEKYKEAMKYFEVKRDSMNYSRAWKYYRKEWVESNMGYVIIVILALVAIAPIIKFIKKVRWEAKLEYEHERKLSKKNK